MISLTLLAAVGQKTILPSLSTLSSSEFKRAVAQVEKSLSASRFAEAETLLAGLPSGQIRIKWSTKPASPSHQAVLNQGRDEAIAAWQRASLGLRFEMVEDKPDILAGFTDLLPISQDSKLRQGAVHFVSFAPSEPKVESVIALRRGDPPQEAHKWDAASEVSYAIGASLGLSRLPKEGGAMGRTDSKFRIPPRVMPEEILAASQNLKLVEALRELAASRTALPKKAGGSAFVGSRKIAAGEALQGRPLRISFQITNQGDGPLAVNVVPDCTCFVLRYAKSVAPGETMVVWADYRTKDFPGPINKALVVYTDDPDMEPLRIPISGNVRPRFRFLTDKTLPVILAEAGPSEATAHLLYDEDMPWQVVGSEVAGIKAQLVFEEFSGVLADPEFDDPARRREGYLMRIKLPGGLKPGRYPMSIRVMTTDPEFPVLETFFNVQAGIVTLPSQAWFGAIENKPAKAWVDLSRPGRPFKVTGLKSNSSRFSAKVVAKTRDGYRIEVTYSGKGTIGAIQATVTAATDDPAQKTIEIPVAGTIQ